MITLSKECFTKDGFVVAISTLKWMKIGEDTDLSVRAKIKTFVKAILPHKKEFDDKRIEAAKELGEHNEKNKNYDFPDPEKKKRFEDLIDEWKKEEFEIRHEPFKLDKETAALLSIAEELALEEYGIIKS